MNDTEIIEYAKSLLDAHGDAAEAEAAQKAREAEEKGDAQAAEDWQRVRAAISSMRGSHTS